MTLNEILNEVYILTGRPDLVSMSLSAARSATLKLHTIDYFSRDLVEIPIDFGESLAIQSFQPKQLFPLWRTPKYLRYLDTTTTPAIAGKFFNIIDPDQVLDGYGVTRTDVAYMAGSNFQINADTPFQYAMLGYYAYPNTDINNFSSWIAEEIPFAIAYEAARKVCKLIGKDSQYATLETEWAEQVALVKITGLTVRGY